MSLTTTDPEYSLYYQAQIIQPEKSWFVAAELKSVDHLVFDRTIDVATHTFEFFVAPSMEQPFLQTMQELQNRGIVGELKQLPNRFQTAP